MRLTDRGPGAWMDPTPGDSKSANRLVALRCAMRITPDSLVSSGAYEAGQVTMRAEKFEDWLKEAETEADARIRRFVLAMVCDKADESTQMSRIKALVKELHHHVTR